MIFLDANVILSYLTEPTSAETRELKVRARHLFQQVASGQEEVTTSEVVLHEVCYILVSKKHYGQATDRVATYLIEILSFQGVRLTRNERAIYMRALDIFSEYPRLGFADSVIAARAESQGVPLATFDEYLAGMPFVTRWVPASSAPD